MTVKSVLMLKNVLCILLSDTSVLESSMRGVMPCLRMNTHGFHNQKKIIILPTFENETNSFP